MDTFITPTPAKSLNAPVRRPFAYIYVISVIFTFHTLLTAYSSSSYLELFTDKANIGLIYASGSILSIGLFFFLSPLLCRFGNAAVTILFSGLAILALVFLGLGVYPLVAFIVFTGLNPLLYLNIDIFSEAVIGENEHETGQKRGLTLSLMALASVFAPLATGFIISSSGDNLAQPYFAAAGIGAIFMAVVIFRFYRTFKDPIYPILGPLSIVKAFFTGEGVRGVISAHFLLQFFFAWIVIYFPLYLTTVLNISWSTMGIIIAVGLSAYVLCEYPIGIMADRFWGEKEMMAIGFLVLAVSSASIGFMAAVGTIGWMVVMFMSRVGASLVEVTTESYFFKKVTSGDAALISLFRVTRPVANLVGALTGTLTLYFFPFPLMFILLGLFMVPGIILAAYLVDTK